MQRHFFSSRKTVYKIAEIGGNHEGSFDEALRLTQLAIECNVDAIKFQIYSGSTLVNKNIDEKRHAHFKKFELTVEQYKTLSRICASSDIAFLASVWDQQLFDTFIPEMPLIKIGSGDANCFPFVEKLMAFQKPLLISTGLCTLDEVDEIVNFVDTVDPCFRQQGLLCLLQCTSMYPIPFEEANLSVVDLYRQRYGVPVGYSDHTVGTTALELAISRGVDVIEFHFTDSRISRSFRDHQVSLLPSEVLQLNSFESKVHELLGTHHKTPTRSEETSGHVASFRRSVYASRLIRKGQRIASDDLVLLRPSVDLSLKYYSSIIGSIALSDIPPLEPVLGHLLTHQ
jgi:N,N'-diacetyllegionaminate synthase